MNEADRDLLITMNHNDLTAIMILRSL